MWHKKIHPRCRCYLRVHGQTPFLWPTQLEWERHFIVCLSQKLRGPGNQSKSHKMPQWITSKSATSWLEHWRRGTSAWLKAPPPAKLNQSSKESKASSALIRLDRKKYGVFHNAWTALLTGQHLGEKRFQWWQWRRFRWDIHTGTVHIETVHTESCSHWDLSTLRFVHTEIFTLRCSQRDGLTCFTFLSNFEINQKGVGKHRLFLLVYHLYVDCFYQRVSELDMRLGFVGYPTHHILKGPAFFWVFLPVWCLGFVALHGLLSFATQQLIFRSGPSLVEPTVLFLITFFKNKFNCVCSVDESGVRFEDLA